MTPKSTTKKKSPKKRAKKVAKKQGTPQHGSKFTKEQAEEKKEHISKLLQEDKGDVSIVKACEAVGISQQTFYNWKDTDSEFREKVETARAVVAVMVEANIKNYIEEEKSKSGIYTTENKNGDIDRVVEVRPGGVYVVGTAADGSVQGQATPHC